MLSFVLLDPDVDYVKPFNVVLTPMFTRQGVSKKNSLFYTWTFTFGTTWPDFFEMLLDFCNLYISYFRNLTILSEKYHIKDKTS